MGGKALVTRPDIVPIYKASPGSRSRTHCTDGKKETYLKNGSCVQ
jgi:hypothetical protein